MLSKRMQFIWIDILHYALKNENKTALFFVPNYKDISELYGLIPAPIAEEIMINLSTSTITFLNGSKIMIKRSDIKVEKLEGIKIDRFEEFGLVSYDVWEKLKTRSKV